MRAKDTGLPEHRFRNILQAKLERGEWRPVKQVTRFLEPYSGALKTLPSIIEISPAYALELIRQDNGERFALLEGSPGGAYLDYLNAKPMKPAPGGRCLPSVPPDLVPYLEAGTGLAPDHSAALRLLFSGEEQSREWNESWRILALHPPGHELKPCWNVGPKTGRFTTRAPNLQSLGKRYRREALFPLHGGSGLVELDFKGCHPNIARILAGGRPEDDPYQSFVEILEIEREQVKDLMSAIFCGQTRQQHIRKYGRSSAPVYDFIREAVRFAGAKPRLQLIEAAIMQRILRAMRDMGLPLGLPVHDSVVTIAPVELEVIMRRESAAVLGCELPVRRTICEGFLPF
jgi:hypothetical protein